MRKSLLAACLTFLSLTNLSSALTVEEAYQAIPHKRTVYSASKSPLPLNIKRVLERLFKVSDQALVARIETMKGLSEGRSETFKEYQTKTDKLLNDLSSETDPEGIQLVTLLKGAIESQRDFFSRWNDAVVVGKKITSVGGDSSVQQASSSLRQLYSVLMTRYRNEHPHNIDAFYQHLCALDFI